MPELTPEERHLREALEQAWEHRDKLQEALVAAQLKLAAIRELAKATFGDMDVDYPVIGVRTERLAALLREIQE